jgi:hypothetical protein
MTILRSVLISYLSLSAARGDLPQCSDQGSWSTESFVVNSKRMELSSPLLLTDGRVMAQYLGGGSSSSKPWQDWYALTPSKTGCYSLNASQCKQGLPASWTPVASLSTTWSGMYAPAAFAAAVLPDGKVIIEGGEDNNGDRVEINMGAIYDPVANTWTAVGPPAGWAYIGDAPSTVLANGTFMLGNACGNNSGVGQTALFNEPALSWNIMSQPPAWTAEAVFTLLPDDTVVFIGTCWQGQKADHTCTTNTNEFDSEDYNPVTDKWTTLGNTAAQLYAHGPLKGEANSCVLNGPVFGEQGPAALLPNGTYFATGGSITGSATGSPTVVHTSIYDLATHGWQSSPDLPTVTIGTTAYPLTAEDQGAVVLTNGNLLIATLAKDAPTTSVYYIEWNGNSYCKLTNVPAGIPSQSEMLTLPTGQIFIAGVSWGGRQDNFIYTPGGTTYRGIEPIVEALPIPLHLEPGSSYLIAGKRFNGATQASFFGDDFQNSTNYPLVRITNRATGHVFYARTHDPNTMGVATGSMAVWTHFDVPANIENGPGRLVVVANGIESNAWPVIVGPDKTDKKR